MWKPKTCVQSLEVWLEHVQAVQYTGPHKVHWLFNCWHLCTVQVRTHKGHKWPDCCSGAWNSQLTHGLEENVWIPASRNEFTLICFPVLSLLQITFTPFISFPRPLLFLALQAWPLSINGGGLLESGSYCALPQFLLNCIPKWIYLDRFTSFYNFQAMYTGFAFSAVNVERVAPNPWLSAQCICFQGFCHSLDGAAFFL